MGEGNSARLHVCHHLLSLFISFLLSVSPDSMNPSLGSATRDLLTVVCTPYLDDQSKQRQFDGYSMGQVWRDGQKCRVRQSTAS